MKPTFAYAPKAFAFFQTTMFSMFFKAIFFSYLNSLSANCTVIKRRLKMFHEPQLPKAQYQPYFTTSGHIMKIIISLVIPFPNDNFNILGSLV